MGGRRVFAKPWVLECASHQPCHRSRLPGFSLLAVPKGFARPKPVACGRQIFLVSDEESPAWPLMSKISYMMLLILAFSEDSGMATDVHHIIHDATTGLLGSFWHGHRCAQYIP